MKNYLLAIVMLIGVTNSFAQVNRYDRAIDYEYQSTYQSLDMDFLINMAKMNRAMKEAQKRTQNLIDEVQSIYNSYPKYPNKIKDGWHEVVQINTSPKRAYLIKAYTMNNNIVKVYVNNEIIDLDRKMQVINGKSTTLDFTLYFLEDIKAYNMN